MATYNERVRFLLGDPDELSTVMRRAAAATRLLSRDLSHDQESREATWEPHDWADFS